MAFEKVLWEFFLALLMLGGGTALVVMIYMWAAWYASMHADRDQLNHNNASKRGLGLSKSDIQKLPTFICNSHSHRENGEEEDDKNMNDDGDHDNKKRSKETGSDEVYISGDLECTVCLEQFKDGERCLLMPTCSHCFHVQCADAWLTKRPICPLCRTSAKPRDNQAEQQTGHGPSNSDIPDSIVVDMPE